MHLSSLDKMRYFRDTYLSEKKDIPLKIADLGSMAIAGSYRDLFAPYWEYTGLDIAPGDNVDQVLSDPYTWLEIPSDSLDVLVSGQAFEHIAYFWKTMREIARVLKPGGLCCIVAPSGGPEHRYPLDCWRFYPDGFRALARYADLEVLEVFTQWEPLGYSDGSDDWADTVLIAQKPESKTRSAEAGHIYQREIESGGEDSLSKIIAFIPPGSRVLELGPATGYLTRYLKENLGCEVDGVEISPEMAESARKYCQKMVIGDLDQLDLERYFQKKRYDRVILADILEHLKAYEKTLKSCRELLKPEGRCILSVPNIAHAAVIGGLLKGRFDYTPEGLLDQTHLRFFTRQSLDALIGACGFERETEAVVSMLPEDTEIGDSLADLPHETQTAIFELPDSLSYQFIWVCKPQAGDGAAISPLPRASAPDLRRLHLQGLNQRIAALENALGRAEQLARNRLEQCQDAEKTKDQAQRELEIAQTLAVERLRQLEESERQKQALEKELDYAWEQMGQCWGDLQQSESAKQRLEKELDYARSLLAEQSAKTVELEEALEYAQNLAYERLDAITGYQQDIAKYHQRINALEAEIQTYKDHPLHKLYSRIKKIQKD